MKQKLIFIFVIVFFYGCSTPIKRIVKQPEKMDGKKVRVKGIVISSLKLDDLKIFYLSGKTKNNRIAVITKNDLPFKNDYIRVKGKVKQNYIYRNKYKMTVILEKNYVEKFNINDRKNNRTKKYKYTDN